MIRTNNKIYGEKNDPNTVLASNDLGTNKYVVGSGNKGVKSISLSPNTLLVSNEAGELIPLTLLPNKQIGTDSSGNIVLLDQEV